MPGKTPLKTNDDNSEVGPRTRLDLGYANRGINNLAKQGAGERADSMLSGTVDGSALVWFTARDRADVNDVPDLACLEILIEV